MNILIPMADGHVLSYETIQSIAMQTIKCDIVPITRPIDVLNHHLSEANSRNIVKRYASDPYTIFLDSDVVFTSNHDIEDLLTAISNSEYDAIALNSKKTDINRKEKNNHVVIACMIVKKNILDKIGFRQLNIKSCCCRAFNVDCKIKYLDDRKLTEIKRI